MDINIIVALVIVLITIFLGSFAGYKLAKKKPKYEEQHIAVDIVILTIIKNIQNVLLIQRDIEPFKNCWAIPGGHLNEEESLDTAAARELIEETSLSADWNLGGASLHQFKTYGTPGRDPRYRVVSVVYYAIIPYSEKLISSVKAMDDAKDAEWFPLQDPTQGGFRKLAFDHEKILRELFVAAVAGALK